MIYLLYKLHGYTILLIMPVFLFLTLHTKQDDTYTIAHCFSAAIQGELFSTTSRVILPDKQPGGWSARGQPCDAIHSVFRHHMSEYAETCLGYRNHLIDRAQSSVVLMSNGNPHLAISHSDSITSAIYGWVKLSKQRHLLRCLAIYMYSLICSALHFEFISVLFSKRGRSSFAAIC